MMISLLMRMEICQDGKTEQKKQRQIFEWRPWGKLGSFQTVQTDSTQVPDKEGKGFLRLGNLHVILLDDKERPKLLEQRKQNQIRKWL